MSAVRFYRIKEEIRILGLDDTPFKRGDKSVMLIGAVFRGGKWLDGVITTRVRVDGLDATDKIARMVNGCKFKDLRVLMLDGLGFGGFNLVDIERLYEKTKLPVIVIVRDMPDFKEISKALDNLPGKKTRWSYIEKAGKPVSVETKPGKYIYIQHQGIKQEDAIYITKLSATRSLIPEPIRVAHLIGQGIVLGESRGRA